MISFKIQNHIPHDSALAILVGEFRKIVDRRLPALALLTQKPTLIRDLKQTPKAIAETKQKIYPAEN